MPTSLTPPRAALLERLVSDGDLQGPVDLDHLEDCEAREWLAASPKHAAELPAFDALTDAVGNLPHATRTRLNTLLIRTLGVMSADDLLELRDILRSALIDGAREQIQDAMLDTVDFARIAHQRAEDARTVTYSDAFDLIASAVRP